VTEGARKYRLLIYTRCSVENLTIERPRVLLLIPHLGGGGAEKVFALLARGLSQEKYELHLGVVTGAADPADAIPPAVSVHLLAAPRVRSAAFRLLALVRRLKPQVIVSGMFHLNFLILLLRPLFPRPVQVLVRQNGTVTAALDSGILPSCTRLLYRMLYPLADRVICQSRAMANDLVRELGISAQHLSVMPNPIEVERIRAAMHESSERWTGSGPHLLAVGRLSREKGFDLLLRALVTVREQFAHADLVIAGTGSEEAALKAQCRQLGLESAVRFVGYIDRPSAYFPGASAFVLSSRHEGLPNALLEAAAGGLPIVALPASGGIVDLLRGQTGSWLASEVSAEALAVALLAALSSFGKEQRFKHPFIEEFRFDRAIRAYEDLIDAAIAGAAIKGRM